MRLSARLGGMLAVALVLAVAPASAMADGNQNHFPAGDYARGGSGCAGSLAAPTTLVVQNFAGTAAAKDAIEAETAWGSVPPESPGPACRCETDAARRRSPASPRPTVGCPR